MSQMYKVAKSGVGVMGAPSDEAIPEEMIGEESAKMLLKNGSIEKVVMSEEAAEKAAAKK